MALKFTDSFIPKDGYWRRTRGFKDHKVGWAGIDYGLKIGSKLLAVTNGYVTTAWNKDDGKGFGRYIIYQIVDSKWNRTRYHVAYAHLNKVRVKKGQKIYQGQWIGDSGNSGGSTDPHLHFSLLEKLSGTLRARDPEHPSYVKWTIKNYKKPPYPKPKSDPCAKYKKSVTALRRDKEILRARVVARDREINNQIKTIESLKVDYTEARDHAVERNTQLEICEKTISTLEKQLKVCQKKSKATEPNRKIINKKGEQLMLTIKSFIKGLFNKKLW
jgi:murein DD-endopeptidase MepM/ murein hydrolase activator NlpD